MNDNKLTKLKISMSSSADIKNQEGHTPNRITNRTNPSQSKPERDSSDEECDNNKKLVKSQKQTKIEKPESVKKQQAARRPQEKSPMAVRNEHHKMKMSHRKSKSEKLLVVPTTSGDKVLRKDSGDGDVENNVEVNARPNKRKVKRTLSKGSIDKEKSPPKVATKTPTPKNKKPPPKNEISNSSEEKIPRPKRTESLKHLKNDESQPSKKKLDNHSRTKTAGKKPSDKNESQEMKPLDSEELDVNLKSQENGIYPKPQVHPIPKTTTPIKIPRQPTPKSKKTFKDLPDSIKRKCISLKLDKDLMEQNIDVLFRISHFLYKNAFPKNPSHAKSSKTESKPYATPEILNYGKSVLKVPTKNPKKLFKNDTLAGSGGYGKVYMAKDTTTKERVAVKKVPHTTDKQKYNNYSEIGFVASCDHPNIVKFYEAYLIADKKGVEEVWMVFQYLHGGTLAEAARAFKFIDRHIAYIAREICRALKFLHDKEWAHRDLKSSNIMMDITGVIKLIDFGLCADMSEGERTKMLGSSFWIPPEMIKREPHSLSADIWSLGVCVLELYLMGPPHSVSSLKCMFCAATVGLADVIPERASKHAKSWLRMCLVVDPTKRASIDTLLEHPWLNQNGIEEGISDIFKSIFLNNTLSSIV
uniref:Protein kinase domain-containing protein n=1 Tax=Arcella intermedia TaxID=1963864 RepID=A0A6B2KZ07_9EUKA